MLVVMAMNLLLSIVFGESHYQYREENQIHVGHSVTERFSIYSLIFNATVFVINVLF